MRTPVDVDGLKPIKADEQFSLTSNRLSP